MSEQTARAEDTEGRALVSILDELTELVTTARAMPMSASVLVNRAEVLGLLDAARAVVPQEIRTADGIVAEAEAVVERARREAAQVVGDAERRAEELVASEAVVRRAEAHAEEIVAAAEARAAKLLADADDWCDRKLAQFEIDVDALKAQVRAGRDALAVRAQRTGAEAGERPEDADGAR